MDSFQSQFCDVCFTELNEVDFTARETQSYAIDRWFTVLERPHVSGSLRAGLEKGCTLCKILDSAGITESGFETARWTVRPHPGKALTEGERIDVDLLRIEFLREHDVVKTENGTHVYGGGKIEGNNVVARMTFKVRCNKDDPAAQLITNRALEDTSYIGDLKRASSWLSQCINEHGGHTQYSAVEDQKEMPARLLHIGNQDGDTLNLEETKGKQLRYAVLSYCWGGEQPQATTLANLPAYLELINGEDLPETLKDAVVVARMLEVDYLWVDSLCIVQDDKEDKAREIIKMASIFRNAYCTVIAGVAAGVSEGFLESSSRLPATQLTIPYPLNMPGKKTGELLLRRLYLGQSMDYTQKRAWCLQESLLSTRTLCFSSAGLHGSCRKTAYWSRDLEVANYRDIPSEIHYSLPRMPTVVDTIGKGESPGRVPGEGERLQIFDYWRELVEEYSFRKYSVSIDRLRALSAMASQVHKQLNDTYLAGLWYGDSAKGLAWYIDTSDARWVNAENKYRRLGQTRPSQHPIQEETPSWSWAVVPGGVRYIDCRPSVYFRVLNASVVPVRNDELFGPVRGGYLHVRGQVSSATYHRDAHWGGTGQNWLHRSKTPIPHRPQFMTISARPTMQQPMMPGPWKQFRAFAQGYDDFFDPHSYNTKSQNATQEVACLELGADRDGLRCGLILEPVLSRFHASYKRIGFYIQTAGGLGVGHLAYNDQEITIM